MLIAGPNLTIDRTLTLAELRPGEVLRFDSAVITPGGKGVNVVRAATALGGDAVLVGLVPGFTGAAVAEMLAHEGIALAAIEVGGEVRSAAVVLERSGRGAAGRLGRGRPGARGAARRNDRGGPRAARRGLGALRGRSARPPRRAR